MSNYLDASILVALFTDDALTERAEAYLGGSPEVVVSDYCGAQFASAVARKVRTRAVPASKVAAVFAAFDEWTERASGRATTEAGDVSVAVTYLRRLDTTLRTHDAIHIAIAQRVGAALATFDERMAASARALGVEVAPV